MSEAAFCSVSGKQRHASLADANHARARQPGQDIHSYHCPHCSGWHIGHGGRRGRHFDPEKRGRGPRLSGNRYLRRKLGEALARGNNRRAAAIVRLIQRIDAERA